MDLALKLKKIHDLMEKTANREALRLNVTFSQHHILMYLLHAGNDAVALKELEKQFGVAQSTMAGIVQRLEEKKLVSCFRDPADTRVKKVSLTDRGKEICEKSRRNMKAGVSRMTSRMSGEEKKELNRLLDILYETIRDDQSKEDGQ